jgi:flagellar hook-associated protein 1 FlgK
MAGLLDLMNVGRESLQAQSYGLNVTGQNVANVNTPGYVKRDVDLETRIAGTVTYGGVYASGLHRNVDQFLDAKRYEASGFDTSAKTRDDALARIEALFNDVGGSGLSSSLSALYSSFAALGSTPSDTTARSSVLEAARTVAQQLNQSSQQITAIRQDLLLTGEGVVTQINSLAGQIGKLNGVITAAKPAGGDAADLEDQRDKLVLQLSQQVNVHVFTDGAGKLVVAAGGATLVEGDRATTLAVSTDPSGAIQILSTHAGGASTDVTQQITGGALGGIKDARDSDAVQIAQRLDQLAYDLATGVNAQHAAGYGSDGVMGRNLFSVTGPAGAANSIALDASLDGHPERVAAASAATALAGDAGNAVLLSGLAGKSIASGGTRTVVEAYSDLVGDVGQRKQGAAQNAVLRSGILAQVSSMRDSVSGVSMDEEMVSLSRYQRAYEASSKLIQTADELLANLIQNL